MSKLALLVCLLAVFSGSFAVPEAILNFVQDDFALAAIEGDKTCGTPQGTAENPLELEDVPGGSIENLIVVGLLGYGMDKANVVKSGDNYEFNVTIIQPDIQVSGDLQVANVTNSTRFFYVKEHDMTLQGLISLKDDRFHVEDDFEITNHNTFRTQFNLENDDLQQFAAALKTYLNSAIKDCNAAMVKFLREHLNKQFQQHKSEQILDGTALPRPKRTRRQVRKLDITFFKFSFNFSFFQVNNINNYADHVLKYYQPNLKKVDPMELPDRYENFTSHSILLPLDVNVFFFKGKLWGLSTLHRAGDVQYSAVGNKLKFIVPLGLKYLKQKYTARVTVGSFIKNAQVTSSVDNLQVTFFLDQNLALRSKPELEQVRVTKIGNIRIKYSGIGPMDWILSRLATFFANSVRWDLVKNIEATLNDIIQSKVLPSM